jgi:methionine synthase II (cobalamin-independent)
MTVLDRLDPWTTTGVGSLPFTDTGEAAAHAAGAYGLPFCPQLPRLDGDMISEWLGADPARCGWSPERDRERPAAWTAWVEELRRKRPRHFMVKLQVTGPVTLACALERSAGQRASRKEAIALARELARWLAANASVQVQQLRELGLATILVVDEPALGAFGSEGIERVWDPLRVPASVWGLHLCCQVPWDVVERAEPDLLSFDLVMEEPGPEALRVLSGVFDRGGWVAWGALPVDRAEPREEAARRLELTLEALDADPSRSLLSPACGSGRMSVARERELATELDGLSRLLQSPTRSAARQAGSGTVRSPS